MGHRAWTPEQVVALGVQTDVVTAASVLGLGRTKARELVRTGNFPTPVLRLGARYVVPTAPLLGLLGLDVLTSDPAGGPRHDEPPSTPRRAPS